MTQSEPSDVPERSRSDLARHWAVGGLVAGCVATLLWCGLLMTLGGWAVGIIEF